MVASVGMTVLASVFLVTPLVLAFLVDRQAAVFQRQAFGGLARSARNLRIMAWAIFVYYGGVILGSAYIGDLQDMFHAPVTAVGVQMYVRIGAAIVGYVFAYFVAKELYEVTLPGQPRQK